MNGSLQPVETDPKTHCVTSVRGQGVGPHRHYWSILVLALGMSIFPSWRGQRDASVPQMGVRCDPKLSAVCWGLSIYVDQTPTSNSYPSSPS